MHMVVAFRDALVRWSTQFDPRGRKEKTIDLQVFLSGLRAFFPRKQEEYMMELRTVVFNHMLAAPNRVSLDRILVHINPVYS